VAEALSEPTEHGYCRPYKENYERRLNIMSGALDTLGDLVHSAYDKVTGKSTPSAPSKPGYTAQDASQHLGGMAGNAASNISGRQAAIDKAISDAGG
jgi:hypothetical protein